MVACCRYAYAAFAVVLVPHLLLTGCDKETPGTVFDGSVSDASGDASDGMVANDASDAGDAGDAGVVTCFVGTPATLFTTLYMPGGRVPFTAEANIGGVLAAATVQTAEEYPNKTRMVGLLSESGAASTPATLTETAMVVSESIAIARLGDGFLTVFDETTDVGTVPKDLWKREVTFAGSVVGTSAELLVTTPGVAESNPDVIAVDGGFAAVWQQAGTGPMTGLFDEDAVLVGSSHAASSSIGSAVVTQLFTTSGGTHVGYLDTDARVHAASLTANGSVSASTSTITLEDSSANFEIASSPSGAGIAYEAIGEGGMTSIKFRGIGSNGTATIAERTLHGIDEHGTRPSVVALAGGYLVLFRFTPVSGPATLRVVFVTASGDVLSTLDVFDAFPASANYLIRVSPDAEVYIVFQEATTLDVGGDQMNGAAVRALRLGCE